MLRRSLLGIIAASALWLVVFAFYPQTPPATYELKPGSTLRAVARDLNEQHLLWEPWTFTLAGRLMGQQGKIKAGSYEWDQPLTGLQLLLRMTHGDSVQSEAKLIEGTTFSQFRSQLDNNPDLRHLTSGWSDQQILDHLGSSRTLPEGLFFPDTYFFNKGGSDFDVMKRSYQAMQRRLGNIWEHRAASLPYENPYQALIMASIIEKETAKADERPMVAAVFVNRLRLGMKLQTDPTVIYGLGSRFDGNLRKRDLLKDNPYNTYTREGLPPSPIAMPGFAALEAAVHPSDSNALYFVSRGDGSHQFSGTLEDHNQAVFKYQLKHH